MFYYSQFKVIYNRFVSKANSNNKERLVYRQFKGINVVVVIAVKNSFNLTFSVYELKGQEGKHMIETERRYRERPLNFCYCFGI